MRPLVAGGFQCREHRVHLIRRQRAVGYQRLQRFLDGRHALCPPLVPFGLADRLQLFELRRAELAIVQIGSEGSVFVENEMVFGESRQLICVDHSILEELVESETGAHWMPSSASPPAWRHWPRPRGS